MPYTPTWNNPYLQQYQPYQQQANMPTIPQASISQQKSRVLVDGAAEAMNRFLMMYPASMLVPGFVSDELFDINGKQFHVLSIEADGRRNLETFDYKKHEEEKPVTIDGADFVSKREYDQFVAKVSAALEALNGVHAAVPATTAGGRRFPRGRKPPPGFPRLSARRACCAAPG